ncbi:MAG: nicotinate-nucleotide adenylyltransferase [Bacteroidetes bacterium]|jgi:nicotinate-nucleotide adenylyltransferase|nr:nicotinate-nucleotide adenylyltransferase [Bacteroidota bacterium]
MKQVGLFFGSFNPIHIGHLIIANYIVEYSSMDEVWFVVSPHNPLKKKKSLLADHHRLYMVELAIKSQEMFQVTDIEFKLPQPSYTIDTLTLLEEKNSSVDFSIIMGSDGLETFPKWKNADMIIQRFRRIVYPRPGVENIDLSLHPNIELVDAPQMDISSSFIRKAISEQKYIPYFLPAEVYNYIDIMNFYR